MSRQRLLEISAALNDLSWSLNDGAVGAYADEIQAIAEDMPAEDAPTGA